MNEVDILKGARAEVAKGWCKNALEDSAGNVCAYGAINRVATGSAHSISLTRDGVLAWQALHDHLPGDYSLLSEYNNVADTTQADILNLFDNALAGLGALA